MDLELNHATVGAAHRVFPFWFFRRVAKGGRGKRRKRKKEKKGSEKRVEPRPPEYVSLNLNGCLSRFPAFGSSWRWCRATSTLIGIWPRSNRAPTRTWSHCFSIRVYRWSALVGIDRASKRVPRSLPLSGIRRDLSSVGGQSLARW